MICLSCGSTVIGYVKPITKEVKMELRWYQTYDQYGLNSEATLQVWNHVAREWEDVPFVREREEDEDN